MLSLLLLILFVGILFKITGFVFRIIGVLLGCIFGIFLWLLLAGLAVTVFGLGLIAVPVILVVGGAALVNAAS